MTSNSSSISKVKTSRVLLVGSGGVGCEVLKNLAISGFGNITLIDLDTIELSNLNRQFLFKNKHIGLSKAEVAAQTIRKMNSNPTISPIIDNIKNPQFDALWFKTFDIVINALDNLDARRHVNLMCQATNVPLIETGTAGYVGQTTVIKNRLTECFECQPKPIEQKTYPVCTIRNTPSSMIHCVVWSKDYLFTQLFTEKTENTQKLDTDNTDEVDPNLAKETETLNKTLESINEPGFPKKLFDIVFGSNIQNLLELEDMWKTRQKPTPVFYDSLAQDSADSPSRFEYDQKHVLNSSGYFQVWHKSLQRLIIRSQKVSTMEFDKDDIDAIEFVASSANLRAHVFGIANESLFQIKAMAGNIIPAIATTNAIIAGLAVMQAIKVISGNFDRCKTIYFAYGGKRPQYLYKEPLLKPNPGCSVCQSRYFLLRSDFKTASLGDLVNSITSSDRGICKDGEFSLLEGSRIVYDPDFEDNLPKSLESLNILPGSILSIVPEDEFIKPSVLCAVKENGAGQLISLERSYGSSEVENSLIPQKRKAEAEANSESGAPLPEPSSGSTITNNNNNNPKKKAATGEQLFIDLESIEQSTVYVDVD